MEDIPVPTIGEGRMLIRVKATGINPVDWKIRDGARTAAMLPPLPTVLGAELAGEVVEAKGSSAFKAGDRVMGLVGGTGADADLVSADPAGFCATPPGLTDVEAAAIPMAAMTAWQALAAGGELPPGGRVLIHGAAGAVGGFAVQFAKQAGRTVFATANGTGLDRVRSLGADTVIDYKAERFEDRATDIDLVVDLVGGETLQRSWAVLANGGVIVSTVDHDVADHAPDGRRGVSIRMKPDGARLAEIVDAVAAGRLRSTVGEVVAPADLPGALERSKQGHAHGKMVVDFTR